MWKIAIGAALTFLGVIGAGIVTYFLQNRQFNYDRKKQSESYKNLLETLIKKIGIVDKKLKENGSIFSECYDVSIQNAVIIKLLDRELFFKNSEVFDAIRLLINYLQILNGKIENYKLIVRQGIRYYDKTEDANRAERLNEVNDYKNEIKNNINFQDIIEKLKNIKNSIK